MDSIYVRIILPKITISVAIVASIVTIIFIVRVCVRQDAGGRNLFLIVPAAAPHTQQFIV